MMFCVMKEEHRLPNDIDPVVREQTVRCNHWQGMRLERVSVLLSSSKGGGLKRLKADDRVNLHGSCSTEGRDADEQYTSPRFLLAAVHRE